VLAATLVEGRRAADEMRRTPEDGGRSVQSGESSVFRLNKIQSRLESINNQQITEKITHAKLAAALPVCLFPPGDSVSRYLRHSHTHTTTTTTTTKINKPEVNERRELINRKE